MSAKSRTKLDTVRVMYTGITINMFHVQCDQNILNNQNTSMHLNIYSEILPVLVIHSRDLTHFVCVCWEGWGVARVRAANQSSLLSPPPPSSPPAYPLTSTMVTSPQLKLPLTSPSYISSGRRP